MDRINGGKRAEAGAAPPPAQAAAPPPQKTSAEPPAEPIKPLAARRAGPIASMPVPPTPAGSVGTVTVTQASDATRMRIGFPFPVHTPAAFFTRAGTIWAVFDAQA